MSGFAHHLRRMWRAALTADSLLSADEAVEALPCPGPEARRWLVENVDAAGVVGGVGLYRWGQITAAVERGRASPSRERALDQPAPDGSPIAHWRDAARVLGISEDTLARRRKGKDPDRACYFDNAAELRAWWRGLVVPVVVAKPTRPPRPRSSSGRAQDGPVNWTEYGKTLTTGRR